MEGGMKGGKERGTELSRLFPPFYCHQGASTSQGAGAGPKGGGGKTSTRGECGGRKGEGGGGRKRREGGREGGREGEVPVGIMASQCLNASFCLN